jgi:CRISPR type IV-associated protein Csf2
MTALWTIRLQGTLRTLTPICIVPPGADEVTRPDGEKFKRIARRSIYQDGLRDSRPVIPGSTLRGRLRRSAVEVVRGLSGGARMKLGEWHQNAVGGIKGAESESAHDVVLRQAIRDKNPILALFGAGSPWMIGRASIGDAMPVGQVETDVVGGVRADDGRRDGDFFVKLDADAPDEWRSMVNVNAERTRHKKLERQLSGDLRAARKAGNIEAVTRIEAELAALSAKEHELNLLGSNSVSMPLRHEAMPAGIDLLHSVTLRAVRPAEVGLFIAALNQFFKAKPHIGQHEALGYGLIGGEYDVFVSPADEVDPFAVATEANTRALGTMTAEPVVGLSNVPPFLVECMDGLKAAFGAGMYDFRVVTDMFGREPE